MVTEKKVDNKLSKSTGLAEFFDRNKIKFQFDYLNTLREKQDKNIKSFFQKTNYAIKNIKNEKNRLMKIRDEFRLSFNSTKDTEAKIFEMLENDKDGVNLDSIILMYKQIVVSEHKSGTISKIHSIISKKKEESILKQMNKFINKETAKRLVDDIKLNKWEISSGLLKKLIDFITSE